MSTGYCSGEDGLFLKSTNGGMNWQQIDAGVSVGLYSIHFIDENTGWICGDSGTLIKTTDGGLNFIYSNHPNRDNYVSDVFFLNQNTGWYGSGDKKIYKTTNGGDNWFLPHQNIFDAGIGAVQFANENKGIAFTYGNKILLTSNGGINWTETSIPAPNYLNNVYAYDENNYWAVGDFGFIYHTSNSGANWVHETNNNFSDRLFGIYFFRNNEGVICGGNGCIVQYQTSVSSISSNNEIQTPGNYVLNQNYPNPFNPKTVISYSLMENRHTTLKVFDVLGKEVAVLVNQKQNAGRYSVEFDASDFTSGVYFYSIESGEFRDIRRMMIIK
jgi:photosystem II stability/assembly factor-like uncharacterized protein